MATQVKPSSTPTPWQDLPAPPSEESVTPEDYRKTFKRRPVISKFADPCEEASKASLECLDRTNYNRDECFDFFRAYRECKKKWIEQRRDDRRNGRT